MAGDGRTDAAIKNYLTEKVKQAAGDDYHLIENQVDAWVARYALKELVLIVKIEIEVAKRGSGKLT